MAQMKGQNKTPEKLNKAEITNLSHEELKTLVIRMPKELPEYGDNIKEEMKATLNEMKKNLQGTNSEGEEVRIQINDLEQKKEKTIQKNKDTKETLGELQM